MRPDERVGMVVLSLLAIDWRNLMFVAFWEWEWTADFVGEFG